MVWVEKNSIGILKGVEHVIATAHGEPGVNFPANIHIPLGFLCFLEPLDSSLILIREDDKTLEYRQLSDELPPPFRFDLWWHILRLELRMNGPINTLKCINGKAGAKYSIERRFFHQLRISATMMRT